MLETLPIILLSPVISKRIDHGSRKILLQFCEGVSGLSILLCVLTGCRDVTVLYLMCMVLSVASFTYNTTVNAYVPDICGNLELKTANTIDSFVSNISMVIAPVLAGMCIEWQGYQTALIIDICTFVLSILFLCFLEKDVRTGKIEQKSQNGKGTFCRGISAMAGSRTLFKSDDCDLHFIFGLRGNFFLIRRRLYR